MSRKNQEVEEARTLLRSKELCATPARIAVLGFLDTCDHPMSHLELTEQLAKVGFEKSTIFRALGDLTEAGLLRKMELGDHVWRFERTTQIEGQHVAHPHLLCLDCGSVQCLDGSQIELRAAKSIGPIEDVLLKGHCKDCRQL